MIDSKGPNELNISFFSIFRETTELFKKSFPVFLSFFIFYSICNGATTFIAQDRPYYTGLLLIIPVLKFFLSIIQSLITPVMLKNIITKEKPKIWLIIPLIGKPELKYWWYSLLVSLRYIIVPTLLMVFCYIFFLFLIRVSGVSSVMLVTLIIPGIILGSFLLYCILIRYILVPIFVLIENTNAKFSIICKASRSALKGSLISISIFWLVIALLAIGIVFIQIFVESFFEDLYQTTRDSKGVALVLLSSFFDSFITFMIELFSCSFMSSIYLHFRERMIANVHFLQLEKITVSKE